MYSQSWIGLRPQGSGEWVNFNQTVTNESVSSDNAVDAMMAAKVYSLQTSVTDQVQLNVILNANSRNGIAYSLTGPTPLPNSYPSTNGATDSGINCMHCGKWVDLPAATYFYGAPGTPGGSYRQIYISSDGYLSVLGPQSPGSIGAGEIAAFSRSLNPAAGGHIYYRSNAPSTYDFYVWWDHVPTVGGNSDPQSFLIWIHDGGDTSSPYRENGIEFWYSSVTPTDGVQTAVGISDEHGGRVTSFTAGSLVNNQELVIKAKTGPMWLSSFKISATDTTGGASDNNAMATFSPSSDPAATVGYNILKLSDIPCCQILLPDYAKTAFGAVSLVPGKTGLYVGLALFGLDNWNQLVQNYWTPKLLSSGAQTGWTDSNPAWVRATAAQDGGVASGSPVDGSYGAKLIWSFDDPARNVPHHLTITGTIGYNSGSCVGCSDTFSTQVGVDLDINPSYKIFSDNFETNSMSPWVVSDPTNIQTNWQTTGNCPPFTATQLNCGQGTFWAWSNYQRNMNSQMMLTLPNLATYYQLVLYLRIWIDTDSVGVKIDYQTSGVWVNLASYSGQISTSSPKNQSPSTAWIFPRLVFPSYATAIRILFVTGCCESLLNGIYIDDMYLFGDGPTNSWQAQINGQVLTTGALIAAPIQMDGGQFFTTPVNFLASQGSHSFTAQSTYTDGTGTYNFVQWGDGVQTSTRTLSVTSPPNAFTAQYNTVPDFTITANPSSQTMAPGGGSFNPTISLTSRNGFTGPVTTTASSQTTGITATPSAITLALTSGSTSSYILTIVVSSSVPSPANYYVTVTGASGGLSSSTSITIAEVVGSGGGIGGSVAHGTLITLTDGSQVPVQNLQVGSRMLGFDIVKNQFTVSTVSSLSSVTTNNMLVINTTAGTPFRVDANPHQTLWAINSTGVIGWVPVTRIQVGDYLFTPNGWVKVTSISFAPTGTHQMFDIIATMPYFASGYLDPRWKT